MPLDLKSGSNRLIPVQHTTEPANQQPAFTRDQFKHFICTINVLNLISILYFLLFTHVTSSKILVRGFSNKTQLLNSIIFARQGMQRAQESVSKSFKIGKHCIFTCQNNFCSIFSVSLSITGSFTENFDFGQPSIIRKLTDL